MIRRLRDGLPVEMLEGWGEFIVATAQARRGPSRADHRGDVGPHQNDPQHSRNDLPGGRSHCLLILSVVSASAGAQNAVMIP